MADTIELFLSHFNYWFHYFIISLFYCLCCSHYQQCPPFKIILTIAVIIVYIMYLISSFLGGEEVKVQIVVECMRPFNESPSFTVSFVTATGERHSYLLQVRTFCLAMSRTFIPWLIRFPHYCLTSDTHSSSHYPLLFPLPPSPCLKLLFLLLLLLSPSSHLFSPSWLISSTPPIFSSIISYSLGPLAAHHSSFILWTSAHRQGSLHDTLEGSGRW